MRILHIHQDFPDGTSWPSTKAVSNLIDEASKKENGDDHLVLSIHRTSNPLAIRFKRFSRGWCFVYWALPLPFAYRIAIYFWSLLVGFWLKKENIQLIHGHKLTTEGMFSFYLAKLWKVDYLISVRGGSDKRNLLRLPDCTGLFGKIYRQASSVFWVSPWFKALLEQKTGVHREDKHLFPNISYLSEPRVSDEQGQAYVTVAGDHNYHRKGLFETITSLEQLRKKGHDISLDIIGISEPKACEEIERFIDDANLSDRVKMLGKMKNDQLLEHFSRSRGLLLPSSNETFGMVYVEALSAGVPILYVEGTGIDGFLDDSNIGIKLEDAKSVEEMVKAIEKLDTDNETFKSSVRAFLLEGKFDLFSKENIVDGYLSVLKKMDNI